MHPHIQTLLRCIELEEKEQVQRFSLDQQHTLKALKAEGLALHPIIVTRKNFGYADYPEISFKLNFPPEANLFIDGAAIECFIAGEEPVKGVLISLDGKNGEFGPLPSSCIAVGTIIGLRMRFCGLGNAF